MKFFYEWSTYYVWLYTLPIKKDKIEKGQSINFDECFKNINTPFYLRNIINLAKILRALLSNKNGVLHFWKSQQFNGYKTAHDFNK